MRVLVTGSQGFIGKSLVIRLQEKKIEVLTFTRQDEESSLPGLIETADCIIHLAGENRPKDVQEFQKVNTDLTQAICNNIANSKRKVPIVFTSSIQAENDTPYGNSKRGGEIALEKLAEQSDNPVIIYRLANTFGKWCKPNYNSVVATFCYNIANSLPIQINEPDKLLNLVYVDDVINELIQTIETGFEGLSWKKVSPEYQISLKDLAEQIYSFKNCRDCLTIEKVGTGLTRALYSTYVSYLPREDFVYDLTTHKDERGVFVEMLKTPDCGQFSFFTAPPGITRGGHYHHTKTEKFLVIKGQAKFRFRHIATDEAYEILTNSKTPQIVETIPGWAHNITNVGDDEMIVMLWANEKFDRARPDTVYHEV